MNFILCKKYSILHIFYLLKHGLINSPPLPLGLNTIWDFNFKTANFNLKSGMCFCCKFLVYIWVYFNYFCFLHDLIKIRR